jgi:hypothetical protein
MEIPEGYTNCRFIFTVTGVTDPMGMSLGVQGLPGRTALEIAGSMYDLWEDVFLATSASMLTGWTFVGVSATQTLAGVPVVREKIAPIDGTGPDKGLIVNSALLVRKNTAAGGRKNRGRMYVPPFNVEEDSVTVSGSFDSGFVTAQTGGWNALHIALVDDDIPPWLFHSDPADEPTPITSFTAQSVAATQRRRMR